MKTTLINQKSFVSVFAALVFLLGGVFTFNDANGQNVSEIDLFTEVTKQSITQNWGERQVIYDHRGRNSGCFILADPQSTTFYHILTLNGFNVTDFVVFHDSVFFTGDNHHDIGFYAYFSLNAMLSGTVDITYRYLSSIDYQFTGMSCIKAFVELGSTNVMLIGNRKHNGYMERCLFNVSNDSIVSSYLHDDNEYFDDVEILDDYIVSVARKGGDEKPDPVMMRFFVRNVTTPPLMYNTFKNHIQHEKNNYALGRVRLQRYSGMDCGVLFKNADWNLAILSFVANAYPVSPLNVINTIQVDTAYTLNRMKIDTLIDVGYSALDSRLFALCDSVNGPYLNVVAKYTGGASISEIGILKIPFKSHSVSGFNTTGFYVSGKNSTLAACWQRIYSGTDCMEQIEYWYAPLGYESSSFMQIPPIDQCRVTTETIRYSVGQNRYQQSCQAEWKESD